MWMTDFAFASIFRVGSAARAASSFRTEPSDRPSVPSQPTRITSRRVGRAKWAGSAAQVPGCVRVMIGSPLCIDRACAWLASFVWSLPLLPLRRGELDNELGPLVHFLKLRRVEVPAVGARV